MKPSDLLPIDDFVIEKIREFREETDYYPTIKELMDETNHSKQVIIKSINRLKHHKKVSVIDIRNRDSILVIG